MNRKELEALAQCGKEIQAGFEAGIRSVEEAMRKQKPQKPTSYIAKGLTRVGNGFFKNGTTVFKCPECNTNLARIYKYCINCGQAIDWSEHEKKIHNDG